MSPFIRSLCCLVAFPVCAFAGAITDFSIVRTVSSDAQAGGAASVETFSSSAQGLFEAERTDVDVNGSRSAKVVSGQRTDLALTAQALHFSGAAYIRNISDGQLVRTIGTSTANIYFTIDEPFDVHAGGTFASAGNSTGTFTTLELFSVLPSGEERSFFAITWEPLIRDPDFDQRIGPGRYHFRLLGSLELSAPEFVPQSIDATQSVTEFEFILTPEPSSSMIFAVAALCMQRRKRVRLFSN